MAFKILNWNNSPIHYPHLVSLNTISDGSCFFHSVANAIYIEYRAMSNEEKRNFIFCFRNDLARELPKYYSQLSRGELENISKQMPDYSLKNLQNQLRNPSVWVDNIFNELISNILNIDIYILEGKSKDYYLIEGETEEEILYKDRNSIVLLFSSNHYQPIGIKASDGTITTYYTSNHPLIETIRKRRKERIQEIQKKEKIQETQRE